jgi:DNA-directed RNA polymerase specialized sigma24 family protein
VADGDHPTLARAYRDHSGAVYGTARYLCGPDLAGEVTHRVFVHWWRDSGDADVAPRLLRTTLLTLAHQHARHLRPLLPDGVKRSAGWGIGAVERLPETERDAIATAVLGKCSYREAAAILGQPPESVRSRIRAGLRRLHPLAGSDLDRSRSVPGPDLREPGSL